MAEKLLQSRIVLKYDSLTAWENSSVVLKAGEVGFAAIPDKAGRTQVVAKVGDGSKTWANLEYISALAADVNKYAKYTDAEFVAEVERLATTKDTDTQYTIVKVNDYQYKLQSKGIGGAFADTGVVIDIPNDTAKLGELEAAIGVINGSGEGSFAKAIADAIAELDLANTYDAKGAAAAAEKAAKDHADAEIKKLAEGQVATNASDIATLKAAVGEGGSVDSKITAAIQALDVTDTAVTGQYVSAVNEVDGKVVVSREALPDYTEVYDAKGAAAAAETAAKSHADGLNSAMNTRVAALEAIDHDAYKGYADQAEKDAKDYADSLAGNYDAVGSAAAVEGKLNTEIERAKGAEKAASDAAAAAQATADAAKGAIDAFLKDADATADAIDTLKEIQAELDAGEANAATMASNIQKNTDAIAVLNGSGAGSVAKAISDAIAAENLDQYATDGELSALSGVVEGIGGRVGTAEGKISTAEGKISTLEGKVESLEVTGGQANVIETVKVNGVALTPDSAKAVDVLVPTGKLASKDSVAEADLAAALATKINGKAEQSVVDTLNTYVGTIPASATSTNVVAYIDEKVAAEGVAALKGRVSTVEGKVSTLEGTVAGHTTAIADNAKAITDGDAATLSAAKGYTDELATGVVAGHTTAISNLQTEVAKKANDADLAAIAKSGNVNDLIQTAGDVLVFDCGSATVNV